jgi:TonB family protein
MRLIRLALILTLCLTLPPLAAEAQQARERQSKDFQGGVVFVERIDEMTDEKLCSVHTPMRGAEAVISGTAVAFFVHERRGPVARDPAPTLRLGQSQPFTLVATDRPYLIAVPKERTREAIDAFYAQSRIIVRWYDLRKDQHTVTLEIGDFGAAYDHAVTACRWPRLTVKRGAFVSPPPQQAPAMPAPLVGQPTGASQGVGALTLNVSDFPYAWYIAAIHRKIKERWDGYALAGQQPAVVFEIARDGGLRGVRVEKTSGNPYYDQAAVRAVTEANPFPPLPIDFKEAVLSVGLQFAHDPTATR